MSTQPAPPETILVDSTRVVSVALGRTGNLAIAHLDTRECSVWTSSDQGASWVCRMTESVPHVELVPLLILADNTVLVGFGDTILSLRNHQIPLPNVTVTDLAISPTGSILAATTGGVYAASAGASAFELLGDAQTDGPHAVVAVTCAADGAIIALTVGGSLWRFG